MPRQGLPQGGHRWAQDAVLLCSSLTVVQPTSVSQENNVFIIRHIMRNHTAMDQTSPTSLYSQTYYFPTIFSEMKTDLLGGGGREK